MQPSFKKSGSSASQIKEPSIVQKHFVLRSQATKSVGHGSTVSSWKSKDSSRSSRQSPEKMVFPETIYIPAWPPTPEVKVSPPLNNLPPSASGTNGFSTPLPLEEIGEEFEEEDGYRSRAGRIGLNGSMQESGRREANFPRPIDIEAIPTIGTQGSDGNEMQEIKKYIPSTQYADNSKTELDFDLHQSILQTKGFDTSENDLTNGIDPDPSFQETHGHFSEKKVMKAPKWDYMLAEAHEDDYYGSEATQIAVNYELSKYAGFPEDDENNELGRGQNYLRVMDYHIPSPSLLLSYNTPKQTVPPEHKSSDHQPRIFKKPAQLDSTQSRRAKHQPFEVDDFSAPRPSRSEEPKAYQRLPLPPSIKVTSGTGSRNDKIPGLPRVVNIHYSKEPARDGDSFSQLAMRTHRSGTSSSNHPLVQREQRSVEVAASSRKRERELSEFLLGKAAR